jgi:hypothetical protein
MALLALAYPKLAPGDLAWIEALRTAHDPAHGLVAAHFTLVFPVAGMDAASFSAAIRQQLQGCAPLSFVLRSALPVKDVIGPTTDVYLVPDEGFGALVRLHDRLYAGQLAGQLRLDIPYIPHITIARSLDPFACKGLADDLNARTIALAGTITALDIVLHEEGAVQTLERVGLG